MDERKLVERAKSGDRDAMEQLYRDHADRVYTVVRRLAGDDALAEDLSQEAWIRAFQRLDSFRGDASFGTWMYRLATNHALNRLRSEGRRRELEDEAAMEAPGHRRALDEAVIDHRILSRALDRLPPGYRQVLVLYDVEGMTHREIAEELGVSVGTSKSQLHKARARMRDLITGAEENGEDVSNGDV